MFKARVLRWSPITQTVYRPDKVRAWPWGRPVAGCVKKTMPGDLVMELLKEHFERVLSLKIANSKQQNGNARNV